jgi:O-antigen/teichoic acid export membrane protein
MTTPVTIVGRLARTVLASDVLKGSAAVLAIKFGSSALGFAIFALSSRLMDTSAFGKLAIIFNAASFLAVVALCGQETLIVRSWDEYCRTGRPELARGALAFGAQIVLSAALLTAAVSAAAWLAWDPTVPVGLVAGACAFLFVQSVMHFSGQFARVAGGLSISELPREFIWRLIVVIVIAVHHALQISFGATEFFAVSTCALLFAVLLQVWHVARRLPQAVMTKKPQFETEIWIARSLKMWLSSVMDTTSQYVEVVVIGVVLGPATAAFYFVCTRITNVFAMISGSITIYAMRQISGLFYADAKDELQNILRSLAIISVVVAVLAAAVVLLGGKLLLWVFGAAYVSAYPALVVLTVGASVSALAGPAGYVLLMTGNEGIYPRVMAGGLLLRFALIAILGPLFGLMGAVIAWSVSAVVIAVALTIACRSFVGLDPSLSSALCRRLPTATLTENVP